MKPLLKRALLLLITSLSVPAWALAQGPRINLAADVPFFQEKAKQYQRWLDHKGIGQLMKVDKVKLKSDNEELELFLVLETTTLDTAIMMWQGLETAYQKSNRGADIGKGLFETFVRFMEIPPAQANVQIYFPRADGFGYDRCFHVFYWEEKGVVKSEKMLNKCKGDKPLEITVVEVHNANSEAQFTSRQISEPKAVFDKILAYARSRYEVERCQSRYPKLEEVKQSEFQLKFAVSDLCQEVLNAERERLWCRIMKAAGRQCSGIRRERLEFTFIYSATGRGYVLNGSLTGKYGSGIYKPRKSGYIDMEPDFEQDFLIPYVEDFQNSLQELLSKP